MFRTRVLPRIGAALIAITVFPVAAHPLGAQQPAARPVAAAAPACSGCLGANELIERFGLREAPSPVRERAGWQPPRRIVTVGGEAWAQAIRAVVPAAEVIGVADPSGASSALRYADVYVGLCNAALVEVGASLKWIQLISAGADACSDAVAERDLLLTNAQALYGPAVADHALALLLALTRRLPEYRDQQREGAWRGEPDYFNPDLGDATLELDGKTVLVVGLGGIGTEIARRAHAFGMYVKGTRASRRAAPEFVEYVGLASEAPELARTADVVVNAAPLTDATRGMFNADFFRRMKPGALFINIGRGESVVTDDLVAALRTRHLAGAGLDVTAPEPLPPGHPLWSMPNVVITPHSAGASDGREPRLLSLVLENLRRYAAGERMLSVVDARRGY